MRVPACAAALALAAFVLGASPAPSPSLLPSTSPASAWPSASPVPAPSGSASARPKTALETPYYRVETDTIVWHGKSGDFDMPHHVAFSRPGSDGTADSAKGNEKAGTITLAGNVVLHDSGNAPEAGPDAADYARGGPATLTCDKLAVDSKAKIYNAEGHVRFEQGTRTATAERGVLNRTTGELHLSGHVKTADAESTMTADSIDYNLNTKKVAIKGTPIIIKQPVPTAEPGAASPTPAPKKRRLPF